MLVVGAYVAVTHVALQFVVMNFSDQAVMVADPTFRGVNLAYAAAFSGLAIAACAAYDRQAREAGMFGLVAFCAAIIGTVNLGANMWFEGFAVPWLAGVVPQVLTAEKTIFWQVGYLSSYLLFAFGWVLFGGASLRAGVFPRFISLAIVVGGIVGFLAARPPYGAVLGLALLSLGIWMVRTRRAADASAQPMTA